MNLAVIGTGYVGLVTGTCFAETGNHVVCVDIDADKIEKLKKGIVPIYEPQLEMLFERNLSQRRLEFTTDLEKGVENAQIIFLALPTPPGDDGSADLSYILEVAAQLGRFITDYKIIVNKSTVPVGTAERVKEVLSQNCQCDFDVVSNPEFLKEGYAVEDFMKPERVIIGTSSEEAKKIMSDLYRPFVRQGNPILFMDERSAELTKYASNSFLATKISFMNDIATLCERTGADVDSVRIGMGSDSRIGKRFLFAGVGYGGSCFPKDVLALAKTARDLGSPLKIIDAVMQVNDKQKRVIPNKIKEHYKEQKLSEKTFAIWGLAFKPNTDDMREAPSLTIIEELLKEGAKIRAFDPEAMQNTKNILGDRIFYADNLYHALEGSDALIICTEWAEFRTPDFTKVESLLKEKVIFDGRNLYDLEQMEGAGFKYYSIGRKVIG